MTNKIILAVTGLLCLALLAASIFFTFKNRELNYNLTQSRASAQKMLNDLTALEDEKTKLLRDKEKLQADTISYLALNTKLQEEKDKLQKGVNNSQKIIQTKEGELERMKQRLTKLERVASKELVGKKDKYSAERQKLEKKIIKLENALADQKAVFYYNLAVAYTQAKLYDDAIETYDKSLEIKKDNPDAYYNLGLIYKDVKQDLDRAAENFKAYLALSPDSPDREEVEGWIKKTE